MPRVRAQKTNFASGEISPFLLGRGDLRAYENGAQRLRNVFVRPTGGLSRRPGLRYLDTAAGVGRLISFEFSSEQVYLLALSNRRIDIYKNGVNIYNFSAPWTEPQLRQLNWTQSADTLLVTHPDLSPKKITRTADKDWHISDWDFLTNSSGRIQIPHHKFASHSVELTRTGQTGAITLHASSYVFSPTHEGARFRFENKELEIVDVAGAGGNQKNGWYDQAFALVKENLAGTQTTTKDWTEQSFSTLRGWPVSVTFHQDRLVIGGSRDLPNTLWLSRSADLFNFDQGEGLDDESIEFTILSDQVNAIRAVFSGRHLQVFTSGAEWMVSGDPLTPTNIQLHRQTRVGSPIDRTVPPRDVDGATIFVPRNDTQLREFLFTDVEQAYQAADLALVSQHLVQTPIDMDYDQKNRLLHIIMANGTLATLTIYRTEQITAWTVQETAGRFLSVSVVGDEVYVLVDRNGAVFVEVFDTTLNVDSGLAGAADPAKTSWSGLGHLEGRDVKVVADGAVRTDTQVVGGTITLNEAATNVVAGLGYAHIVQPLPPTFGGEGNGGQGARLRPISLTFRLYNTYALTVDTGRGLVPLPFRHLGQVVLDSDSLSAPFTGDKTVRAFGWHSDGTKAMWRIEQDTPMPFHLLSATQEISINL